MSGKLLSLSLVVLLAKASLAQQFKCPNATGHYPDPIQCDLYYTCTNNVPVAKLCKDGLVFRAENPKKELCDLPQSVNCGDRTEFQEPIPSPGCPRQNGHFKVDAPASCDRYHNCINGVPEVVKCDTGLVYDEDQFGCVWPYATTVSCDKPKRNTLPDGFTCPEKHELGPNDIFLPHPTYAHDECDKFYICKDGVEARLNRCDSYLVYNHDFAKCTDPEQVDRCKDFYKDVIIKRREE